MEIDSAVLSVSAQCVGFRFVVDPRDSVWRLHAFRGNGICRGLLGWVVTEPHVEGGVPVEVGGAIARVLCRSFSLDFTYTGEPPSPDIASVRRLRSPLVARWLSNRGDISMAHTTHASFAQRMFDSGLSWTQQAQIVFLSPPAASPPPLSAQQVYDVLECKVTDIGALMETLGVAGVMLAGVDGDFAEFIFPSSALLTDLIAAFENECAGSGLEWRVVSEDEFKQTTWLVR